MTKDTLKFRCPWCHELLEESEQGMYLDPSCTGQLVYSQEAGMTFTNVRYICKKCHENNTTKGLVD